MMYHYYNISYVVVISGDNQVSSTAVDQTTHAVLIHKEKNFEAPCKRNITHRRTLVVFEGRPPNCFLITQTDRNL